MTPRTAASGSNVSYAFLASMYVFTCRLLFATAAVSLGVMLDNAASVRNLSPSSHPYTVATMSLVVSIWSNVIMAHVVAGPGPGCLSREEHWLDILGLKCQGLHIIFIHDKKSHESWY